MKQRQITLLIFFVCSAMLWAQNNMVYYYERVKKVEHGQQTSDSGDGHYLAINSNGLYECNERGSTLGYGFVKYRSLNNGPPTFEGDAYLGHGLDYVFNSDYSRLNIIVGGGVIYVYERRRAPSSASAKRVYRTAETPVTPIIIETPSPSTSPSPSQPSSNRRPCSLCRGTGRQVKNSYATIPGEKKWCGECHEYVHYGHYHVRCELCMGKGYLE